MGGSSWSHDLYEDRVRHRAATSTPTFAHDVNIRSGRTAVKAHDVLNPHGIKVRESRDSDAHPESVAVMVFFDETGSMHTVPRRLQEKLTKLMTILKKYCKDPQILVGAVGDYYSDRVPLQIGQFESGIEIDEQIGLIYLEGNGGGTGEESYQNALYFAARKTSCDCWEKRGKKGYLFLIGDEKPYGASSAQEIETIFGDKIEGSEVKTVDLIREAQERFHIYFIIPGQTTHCREPQLRETWANLIGPEHVLDLAEAEIVCETIGSTIGMFENSLTLDQIEADLGGGKDALMVRSALDALANSTSVKAAATGNVPKGKKGKPTNVRL